MAYERELDLQHILQNTSSVWPALAGTNILLTGASGFVGRWLVESFLWNNVRLKLDAHLYVLTRNPQAFASDVPGMEVLLGDLKTFRFPDTKFQYLIHAAVEHEAATQDAQATVAANLIGVDRIVKLAERAAARKILFISSGAVYGEQPSNLSAMPETFIGAPQASDSYAMAKRASEERFIHSPVPAVIARLFAFVGPHLPLDRNFAIGNFIRDALQGGPIRIESDGAPLRSYLYAADLAIWLWTLLIDGKPGRAYNVGGDEPVSILQLATKVEKIADLTKSVSVATLPLPRVPPKRYIPSIDRARSELNLQPIIALDEGIRRTFEWAKQNYSSTK